MGHFTLDIGLHLLHREAKNNKKQKFIGVDRQSERIANIYPAITKNNKKFVKYNKKRKNKNERQHVFALHKTRHNDDDYDRGVCEWGPLGAWHRHTQRSRTGAVAAEGVGLAGARQTQSHQQRFGYTKAK